MNDKDLEQLERIAAANRSEYHRLIADNRQLHRDLMDLRHKYGFPLPHTKANFGHVQAQWFDRMAALRHFEQVDELNRDIDDLMQRYDIPRKWDGMLLQLAMLGEVLAPFFGMGFSGSINPETGRYSINYEESAIYHPVVRGFVATLRKVTRPKCPPPLVGPHNKKDYTPVLEYYERYSVTHGVTHQDIADDLGIAEKTIRNRFSAMKD